VDGGEAGVDIREINQRSKSRAILAKQTNHTPTLTIRSSRLKRKPLQDILFAGKRLAGNIFVAWLVPRWFPLHRERRSVKSPLSYL
jgi:hypothetical protein